MATIPKPPEWHVLGPGAIGCLWAAYWLLDGVAPRLIARSSSGTRQFYLQSAPGYQGDQGDHAVSLQQCRATDLRYPLSHLLITTKAQDTQVALDSVASWLEPDAIVLVVQNGLAATQLVLPRQQRVLAATTTDGAYFGAPDRLIHAGRGCTRVGEINTSHSFEETRAFLGNLPRGLRIEASANIRQDLWRKFGINCAVNALCAIHDCRNGELLQTPQRQVELNALCAEIGRIARACGQDDWFDDLAAHARQVLESTAANINSMLQDLRRGARTEVGALNGYLINEADRLQLPSPLNQRVLAAVLALEGQSGRPPVQPLT